MKRVLIISYYWPPTGGSGVQRWVKFAKYLPSEGWQPVVYTPLNPERKAEDETLLKDVPAETEVIKTPIREPYDYYRMLTGTSKSKGEGEVNPISGGQKTLKQKISLWIRGNFFIPDPRVWWVNSSVKYLINYLKDNPVDVIVTSGPPQSMHLIGRGVHRATGIPWIADFRDPWTKVFYFKHLHLSKRSLHKHEKMEQSVLDECNAVISVTPLVQEEFRQMTKTPVHLITNGFDTDDFPEMKSVHDAGVFNITHTGLFAADGNPVSLWRVLAGKCNEDAGFKQALRIRLAGKVDNNILNTIMEYGLHENLVNLGYLSHLEAVREQQNADVLMLPLRQEPEYRSVLPGKIYEYLAAKRPILGIGQTDGAAAMVLDETHTGNMYEWEDINGISAFIDNAWKTHLKGDSFTTPHNIDDYSRKNLTKKLVHLLDEVSK